MADIGPKIPSFIDQIQFIKYYLSTPCDVPYTAYLETAKPIAFRIATTLLQVDLPTFVKDLFRPKWVRTRRHTRKGIRNGRRRAGIPEPAEVIAETLDKDGDLRLRTWPMGTYMLVQASEIIDRAAWTVFVFEMLDGLLINSILGVIEDNRENCPEIARMLRHDDFLVGGGAGPTDYPVNIDTLDYNVGMPGTGGTFCFVPEGRFVAVFSGAITSDTIGMQMQPRLRFDGPSGPKIEEGPNFIGDGGAYQTFTISFRVEGPGNIFWTINRSGGFFDLAHSRAYVVQTGT